MARVVIKTAKGPFELKPSSKSTFICMCGLSKNQPFCDGSHKKTLDEKEKLYEYDHEDSRKEIGEKETCCGCSCSCEEEK